MRLRVLGLLAALLLSASALAQQNQPRPCPARETCVEIPAGTHQTVNFSVPFRFTVPAGWELRYDSPSHVVLGRAVDEAMAGDYQPTAIHVRRNARALSRLCLQQAEEGVPLDSEGLSNHWRRLHSVDTRRTDREFVGGLIGLRFDITMSPTTVQKCDWSNDRPIVLFMATGDPESPVHVLYMGERERVFILDHDGGNVVIEITHTPDSTLSFVDWLEITTGIVASFEFLLQ